MILLDWLRSHCRLTDTPGVFASQVAERFLIENEGTTESVVAQLLGLTAGTGANQKILDTIASFIHTCANSPSR